MANLKNRQDYRVLKEQDVYENCFDRQPKQR